MCIINYRRILFNFGMIILCSCGQRGAPGSYVREVIDPDGVHVIENGSVPRHWDGTYQELLLLEQATIGRAVGPDEQLISSAGSYICVSTGPDGQIGYVEPAPTELRVYDGSGNFLWRAGRSGEGPGEWRIVFHLEYVIGTGWVLITHPYKILIFDEAGTLVDSKSIHDVTGLRSAAHFNLHPSGISWSWIIEPSNKEISYGYIYRGNWMSLEASVIDTVLNSTLTIEGPDSAFLQMMPRSMAIDLDGRLWLHHTIEYQFEVFSAKSNEHWRVRREYEYSPYTRAEREQAESTWIAGGYGDRNWYRRLHNHRPPINSLKWINEEELWVFTSTYIDSPIVQVDVFDSKGVYQRAFGANETLRYGQFQDGMVWLLRENEEGVPQLNRFSYSFEDEQD